MKTIKKLLFSTALLFCISGCMKEDEGTLTLPLFKEYNVDVVMCIDCTGSMRDVLDIVKAKALQFGTDLKTRCEEKGKVITELRVRTIAFRDFDGDGSDAIATTDFLHFPEYEQQFKDFINNLKSSGGGHSYGESGLEALSLAINSDWSEEEDRLQVIVVWSDEPTHPLKTGNDNSLYPHNMPSDFEELTEWWQGENNSKMDKHAKRLVLFTPNRQSWSEIGSTWENTIHYPYSLSEIDYNTIISTIVTSI